MVQMKPASEVASPGRSLWPGTPYMLQLATMNTVCPTGCPACWLRGEGCRTFRNRLRTSTFPSLKESECKIGSFFLFLKKESELKNSSVKFEKLKKEIRGDDDTFVNYTNKTDELMFQEFTCLSPSLVRMEMRHSPSRDSV